MGLWFRILGWLAFLIGVPALVLYAFFFDIWVVSKDDPLLSASIEPTLSAGDVVVVTRHTTVSYGDLERCDDPEVPGRFVIGRAMAHAGDSVEVNDEMVMVDGKRNPSPHACDHPTMVLRDPQTDDDVVLACSVEEFGDGTYLALRAQAHPEPPTKATCEYGRWFLVSDDRHFHLDSRDYGPIAPSTCQHIVFRLVGAAGIGDKEKRLTVIW
jgi:signal peptidase I